MKIPSVVIVLFSFSLTTNAQSPVSNAVQADKSEIHGDGKNNLGYIIHVPGLNTPLFLENSSQIKDSLGRYITEFKFGNPSPVVSHRISLILQFNGEVDSVNFFTDGTAENIHTTIGGNNQGASYQASELSANGSITFRLISRKKMKTYIIGVAAEVWKSN